MTPRVWYMQGVVGRLSNPCLKALGKIAAEEFRFGRDVFVTSIEEGIHSPGSLHYNGNAFDLRPTRTDIQHIKHLLGPDFDVVDEQNHYHIEFDPKG